MKRKTGFLLESAKNSLTLAIELFNRPYEQGRTQGVVLFLDHAFEMLLKAVIFEKTGSLRTRREKFNYGFEKCVNICHSQLHLVDKDEALILKNLNGFRDAAAHDVLEISEGLLYSHAQSAVQIFGILLKKVFRQDLSGAMPARILPISTSIPRDVQLLISSDLEGVRSLLSGNRRRQDEAEARLKPYEIIERNLRAMHNNPSPLPSSSQIVRRFKTSDWKTVLPMVAGLVQPSSTSIPISIHITKHEGYPVRVDPTAATTISFRFIKTEDKYPYLTTELGSKLGISVNKVVSLVKLFDMKGKDEYHTTIRISKKGHVQRYSEKAHQVLREAIQRDGADALCQAYKSGARKNPADYWAPPAMTTAEAGVTA